MINGKLVSLESLFVIQHGNKFDMNKMEQCDLTPDAISFIGRSGEGNGVVGYVRQHLDIVPHSAGLITVALGGSALSSFVQQTPFYTGQNIDILKPISEMSLDVKMYYCLCIESNRFRYSTFGREANRTLKKLLVPDLDAIPSWVEGTGEEAINELIQDLKPIF